MVRLPGVLVVLALVASACTVGSIPTTTSSSTTLTSTSTTTSTTSTITVPSSTTTTAPPVPLGLVTPTGVPVAILGPDQNGWLVLTPCGEEATVSDGAPIHGVDVVIDPGHGGPNDTGAVAVTGLVERDLNLDVARVVQSLLALRGIEAVLTRTRDYPSRLFVRSNLADSLGARALVSIHHNGPTPPPSETPGTEVFIQKDSDDSQRLGGLLYEYAIDGLSNFDINWSKADDAGVMTVLNTRGDDAYGMIRHPITPSALIELGYLSNPAEAELFAQPIYQLTAARAVADAIVAYLTSDDAGAGLVEGRVFNPNPGISAGACDDPALE